MQLRPNFLLPIGLKLITTAIALQCLMVILIVLRAIPPNQRWLVTGVFLLWLMTLAVFASGVVYVHYTADVFWSPGQGGNPAAGKEWRGKIRLRAQADRARRETGERRPHRSVPGARKARRPRAGVDQGPHRGSRPGHCHVTLRHESAHRSGDIAGRRESAAATAGIL